jgi:hypothetical protein
MCGGVQLRTVPGTVLWIMYIQCYITDFTDFTMEVVVTLPCCDALFFLCVAVVCCIVRDLQRCAVVNTVLYLQWRCCGQAFICLNTECNVFVCIVLYSATVCNDVPWYAETLSPSSESIVLDDL